MKTFSNILLALLPSFLHVNIRRLGGHKIGKGAKLRFGSLIVSNTIEIGANTRIGPFTYIKARYLKIGDNTVIKPLAMIKTLKVNISDYVHIAPASVISSEFTENAGITIGDHSRIFPYCWLDAGEGITIGKHVGIGGHTLMFTHGVWSNFVDGGPVNFGPIKIEDNVWLPWRVFILPNVVIGENAIIGANSLINKSIEANTLAGGSPAKEIKKIDFDSTKKKERFEKILTEYASYLKFKDGTESQMADGMLVFNKSKILIDRPDEASGKDLLILINISVDKLDPTLKEEISILDYNRLSIFLNGNKATEIKQFISFLRRYGVRLYINK